MNFFDTLRLGSNHLSNSLAENFRIHSSLDFTKPVAFYGIVNERCNVKCRQCEYWRLAHYKQEMSITEWQKALISIKNFVGSYSINFSGGEPFIKKDFIKLLEFGNRNKIYCGVTTNGSCLNPETARKVVATKPFNVNISVDAPNAELHDYLRGQPGLFEKLSQGIQHLIKEQSQQGIKFPIIIKPTINRLNFKLMPELVKWAETIGATAVNIQPVNRWTSETYKELWIEQEDLKEFEGMLQSLIRLKHSGAPIMNSEYVLSLLPSHFREELAPPDSRPCRVGLRNFLIDTVGDVKMCNDYPVIGNIKEQEAQNIWYSQKAKIIREQTLNCNKLCVSTVASHKSFKDKTKMALQLLD